MEKDYWITTTNEIKYPHDFTDVHLKNTILFIEKNLKPFIPKMRFIQVYDNNLKDIKLSDLEWLRNNCNIYKLLLEESEKRKEGNKQCRSYLK